MNKDIPEFYLPAKGHCIFTRYYTFKCQTGAHIPIWVYDKYIIPFC